MKKIFKFALLGFTTLVATSMVSCSDDKDEPDNGQKEPDETYVTTTIGFKNVPTQYLGGPTFYGGNLYYGAEGQITTGYLAQIYEDTYAQFSVNYGETYDTNDPYGYTFFAGGLAISSFHDMTVDTYENQLSVYNTTSPSGGNFIVSFGDAEKTNADYTSSPITNPNTATYSDYAGCGRVYITDAKGYSAPNPGTATTVVTGDSEDAFFESVMINNTTYAYKIMENGNSFTGGETLEEQEGWFKVQFIAFDDTKDTSKAVGYVEAYLANFDKSLEKEAGFYGKILSDWTKVDLSSLPECSVLVINMVGSDCGQYGLNTPAYCALDSFEISVEK